MKNIWDSLVKNPKETLERYFDLIMSDLLANMGARLWRTREASCAAIASLISGQTIGTLKPHLEKLWTMSFRALDDVKESVRKAAFVTCRTLINITVKNCDPDTVSPKDGRETMAIIVPYIVTNGLISSAEDVRKLSLATVLTLCKKSRQLLKPHVATIIPTLIERLSELEPKDINYLSFHVEKYNIT